MTDNTDNTRKGHLRAVEVLDAKRDRPDIEVEDVQLREPGQQSLTALTRMNKRRKETTNLPRIYVRGDEPVRIRHGADGEINVQEMSEHHIAYELTQCADYWKTPAKGDPKNVYPPKDVAKYCLAASSWTFPKLRAIVKVPTFRPDGTVLTVRGHDDATGLIYDPPTGFEVEVPETPTEEDVAGAIATIKEVIGEFPFADQASLANTLALGLTPTLREVITGPVPLAALDKPTPGTGASLLVETLALATTGVEPGAMGVSDSDEEQRKQITAKMRSGDPFLFLDNVSIELKTGSLARALTSSQWEDRILGISKTLRVPIRCTWAATGNNLELSLEIARRSYHIRLDARMERPWERETKGFAHPDLKGFVWENRAKILSAFLTLGRNWFAKGQPTPKDAHILGSFESWSKIIGGVLDAAGIEGFLANSGGLYEKASESTGMWAAFLEAWYEDDDLNPKGVTTKTLANAILSRESMALREALPEEFDPNDTNLARRLGNSFKKHVGVRYGKEGFHITKTGKAQRSTLWAVRTTGDGDDAEPTLDFGLGKSESSESLTPHSPHARARESVDPHPRQDTGESSRETTTEDAPQDAPLFLAYGGRGVRDSLDSPNKESQEVSSEGQQAKKSKKRRLTPEEVERYERLVLEGMAEDLARATVRGEEVEGI